MKNGIVEDLEHRELIEKFREEGFGDIVDALLDNEQETYTKKGRLNKCGACRVLDVKTKQLEDRLEEMKELAEKMGYGLD